MITIQHNDDNDIDNDHVVIMILTIMMIASGAPRRPSGSTARRAPAEERGAWLPANCYYCHYYCHYDYHVYY